MRGKLAVLFAALVLHGVALEADYSVAWAVSTIKLLGGRNSYAANLVAYDFLEVDNYYDVYTANADGTSPTCRTCGVVAPNKHIGTPRLSPDGAWALIQVQRTDAACTDAEAHPGLGGCNELKLLKLSDNSVTDVRLAMDALLWGQWKPDQTEIMWSEKTGGAWRFCRATISGTTIGTPACVAPADADGFYEVYSYLPPDYKTITGACICDVGDTGIDDQDVFTYNTVTGTFTKLTDTDDVLDEHLYADPFDPGLLVYISSSGNSSYLLTDLWSMRPDGSNKKQLTFFNTPRHAMYVPTGLTLAGTEFVSASRMNIQAIYSLTAPRPSNIYQFALGTVKSGRQTSQGVRPR